LACVTLFAASFVAFGPSLAKPNSLTGVSYTGSNYYAPAAKFTHCRRWTWLQATCYRNPMARENVPRQLTSDLRFIVRHQQGTFQRVWISIDELMVWNRRTGFIRYDGQALANVDDALRRFAALGIKVDLVLLQYAKGTGELNQFHPEALDGRHPAMRAGYLRAIKRFIVRLSLDPVVASTVAVVDLENEPYFALEEYFQKGRRYLGRWTACWNGRQVDSDCVDQTIIHPWLKDLYRVARLASNNFLYTVSDTGRLLQSDPERQRYWIGMYPVDVFDIHMYDDKPALDAARWATASDLPKVWFAGEVGCAAGHVICTYDGTRALGPDRWWMSNLGKYGACAVLIEDRTTAWTYRDGPHSQYLTPTGREVQRVTRESPDTRCGGKL